MKCIFILLLLVQMHKAKEKKLKNKYMMYNTSSGQKGKTSTFFLDHAFSFLCRTSEPVAINGDLRKEKEETH